MLLKWPFSKFNSVCQVEYLIFSISRRTLYWLNETDTTNKLNKANTDKSNNNNIYNDNGENDNINTTTILIMIKQ